MSTRIKTVFSKHELPHIWANNSDMQRTGKTGSNNFNFRNCVLYSYATPIARRIELKKIGVVFLLTDKHYSVTTAGQQSLARQACANNGIVLRHIVDIGCTSGGYAASASTIEHKTNLNHYRELIQELSVKTARARDRKQWHLSQLQALINEANLYASTFKLKTKFTQLDEKAIGKILENQRAESKLELKWRKQFAELAKKRNEDRKAKLLSALPLWLKGESVELNLYGIKDATGRNTDYARIEGEELETTQGARVPVSHAKRAIGFVLAVMSKGEVWTPNGKTIHLGDYAVSKIDGIAGNLTIGCHTFDRAELERIAGLLADCPEVPSAALQTV